MVRRLSFRDEIASNRRQSFVLIFFVLLVLLALVYVISAVVNPAYTFIILIFGTVFSFFYIIFGYYNSDKIAIASVNARLASASRFSQYHSIVEGLCLASGLPKPRLYVMQGSQINAFASGRDPQHAVICVTEGALRKLSKHELEGVLAHEMSHIANFDIRFMTLTAVLVGMVSIVAQIFLRSLFWSSLSGGGNNRDNKGAVIFLVIGIVLAIVAPLVTMLVQLAISRKREYGADSSAVKFMRSPTGLIGALKKIKADSNVKDLPVSGSMAPLFLNKPRKRKAWFSTHPPLEDRIKKLERM